MAITGEEMRDHQLDRSQHCTVSRALFAVAIGIAVLLLGCERRKGQPVGVKKSRQIMIAIAQYQEVYGRFPYDERGSEYALYQLHDLIDADQFQLRERTTGEPPRWDHDSKRLLGGDVIYINQPLTQIEDSGAIIFMGTPAPPQTWTYVGHLGFGPWRANLAATPDHSILGSRCTVDNLYVVGRDLFEDLAVTHVVSGHSWSTTSDSERGLISASVAGRELRYHFVGSRIQRCAIKTDRGTVVEEFRTDSLGQVTGVTRSPPNWREILGPAVGQ